MTEESTPEGWYPDPNDAKGRWLRYWDGAEWSEQSKLASKAERQTLTWPAAPVDGEGGNELQPPPGPDGHAANRLNNVLAVAGWITAIVLPLPVGMVIGAILASRDDKRGRYILGVAIAIAIIWIVSVVLLLNAAEHQAVRTYYEEPY